MIESFPKSPHSRPAAGPRAATDPSRYPSTRGGNRRVDSLIRVAIQNRAANVAAFGSSRDQFLIPLGRNSPIAIDISTAKFQIKLPPSFVVSDREQHPRLH